MPGDSLDFFLDRTENPEWLIPGQSCFSQLTKECGAPVEVFVALDQVKIQLINKDQNTFVPALLCNFNQLLDLLDYGCSFVIDLDTKG